MRLLVHDFGGFPFIMRLCRHLAEAGHEVTCVYANLLENARTEGVDSHENLKVISIPMSPGYRKGKRNLARRFSYEVAYGRRVAETIRSQQCDVVLSSNTPTHAQYFILKECRRQETAFVYWIQDFYSLAVGHHLKNKIPVAGAVLAGLYASLERKLYRNSDLLIPISHDFRPTLNSWGIADESIRVIQNWAPIEEIPALPKDNAWARRHGLADKFCFLYSGTLGAKHNPRLLHRLAEHFRENPEVRIVVVAEGPGADELEALASEQPTGNLVLLPLQKEEDYPSVLATGDVLMAILEESASTFSVPSKVLSYLCAERAVLLSAPSANLASRIVTEAEGGYSTPPGQDRSFIQRAERLYEEARDGQTAYGHNNRAYAESHFRAENILTQFETILDRIRSGNRSIGKHSIKNTSAA